MGELMNNEIGDTLEALLKRIPKDEHIYVQDLLDDNGVEWLTECLFTLEKWNYIASPTYHGSHKRIQLGDEYQLTPYGKNYLELRRRWWERFRMKSVYIPMAVAFVTALVTSLSTATINAAATRLFALLQTLLPPG